MNPKTGNEICPEGSRSATTTTNSRVAERAEGPVAQVPEPVWKRPLDLGCIALALPVLLPVLAVVTAWIRVTSGGSVFFRQKRVGRGGEQFTIYKFRSMVENADTGSHASHVAELLTSDEPMTKLDSLGDDRFIPGAGLLRSTGLDELPQLINVIRGEMSLVGPRPCLPEEFAHYDREQRERFGVAPGLTGYWQVSGKNRTTFTEMVALDVHYARNRSLWLDLQIIALTPWALLVQVFESRIRPTKPPKAPPNRKGHDETMISK